MQVDVHAHMKSPIGVHLPADSFKASSAAMLLASWFLRQDILLLSSSLVWAWAD